MIEPKISLTMILQGRTMVSQQVAENKPKEFTEEQSFTMISKGKKGKVKKETITFNTRKCEPASQVLIMSKEAYLAMIKEPSNPKFNKIIGKSKGKPVRVWDSMTIDARLRKHFDLIAHDFKALSYSYEIFED